jgi:hypothetical protein
MDKVLKKGRKRKISEVSVDGQVVEEKDQDPSILVDIVWDYSPDKVKLFGEELKHRLKGHTLFFREDYYGKVKGFFFGLIDD